MGVFSDKMTEVAKLNKLNIDSKSAEKAEQSISEIISTIEKNDMSKANEVRKKILGIIETDISKYINASGEINVKDFVKSFDYIKKETMEMQSIEEKNSKEENIINSDSEKKEETDKGVEDTFFIDEEYGDFGKKIEERERNFNIDLDKASEAVDNFSKKYGNIDKNNLAVSDLPEELIQALELENTPENENEKRKLLYEVVRKMQENGIEIDLKGDTIEDKLDGIESVNGIWKKILEADKTIAFKLIKSKGQELSIDSLKEMVKEFGMDFEEFKLIYTEGIQVDDDELFKEIFDKTITIENLEKAKSILRNNPIKSKEELINLLKNSPDIQGIDDKIIDEIIRNSENGGIEKGIDIMLAQTHDERELGIGTAIKSNLEKYRLMLRGAGGEKRENIIHQIKENFGVSFDKNTEITEQLEYIIGEVGEYLKEKTGIVQEKAKKTNNCKAQNLADVLIGSVKTIQNSPNIENSIGNSVGNNGQTQEQPQIQNGFNYLKPERQFIIRNLGRIFQERKHDRLQEKNIEELIIEEEPIVEIDEEIPAFEYEFEMNDYEGIFIAFEEELGISENVKKINEEHEISSEFSSTISSIFPMEETKKIGIDLSAVGLDDFIEVLDAFASGNKEYLLQVLLQQQSKEMQYIIDNFKQTLGMSNYIEQHGFVPKEVIDRWKQMQAEGKDPFEEMRKEAENGLNLDAPDIAKIDKSIKGPTTIDKAMAKPKEIVLDYMEMDINAETDPKNATMIMAEQLKQSKVLTKFKGMSENGLDIKEYSDIMAGVVIETERMMEDGRLPKNIVEQGVEREAGTGDFINMTFDNTEILLSNMPEKAGELGIEKVAELIEQQVVEATKEKNIDEQVIEDEKDIEIDEQNKTAREVSDENLKLQEEKKQEELAKRLLEEQKAKEMNQKEIEQPKIEEKSLTVPEEKNLVQRVGNRISEFFNSTKENVKKFFKDIKDRITGKKDEKLAEEVFAINENKTKDEKDKENDDFWRHTETNLKEAREDAKKIAEKRETVSVGKEER